ncbi:dienelactone hydrolase family protein [Actinosynnema pretiosum subsp. pretiosum]|uniref:Dienelactone hydrolase n=2 Tax=Actinosynnema TaxID=40566 RepID=C6WDX3_ACTMD|nr:dienelactone hydrolase family protein [Actinosynnema mirum]ACU34118.1 dienelactone hydrolase [Actinosynnema mirum DSM 43827]AXX27516.1 putative carboxymethylenebutenolidase [Actinosynnema pretiosum subsp. pretiosum]QUF01772.1 dienelactone hydrolase family protein [Actinosynnema pretiosum subsp. pretiosum]
MKQTRIETLQLTDGRELRMTVAEPESAVRGGLVVLHEARGVTDAVRGLVSGLAAEGWLAVAPHLYADDELDDDQAGTAVSGLDGESVLADTDVAFVWLGQRGVSTDLMGVVGFDLGGSVAMAVAASRSVGAAVTVGGGGVLEPLAAGLPPLVDLAQELACPWLGLYGASDDGVPAAEVAKLRDAAAGAPVATDVVRYEDSEHRFDTSPSNASDAWQRALNWFDSHLR